MSSPLPRDGLRLTACGAALITEADGSMADGATGLYVRDRRWLSGLRFLVDGELPETLRANRVGPGQDRIVYGLWDGRPDPAALIVRTRTLGPTYRETLAVQAFDRPRTVTLELVPEVGGATIYHLDTPEPDPELARRVETRFALDGFDRIDGGFLVSVDLVPGQEVEVSWTLDLDLEQPPAATALGPDISGPTERMAVVVANARWDLQALTVVEPETKRPFLAAGSPHFLAVFGRDALLGSMLAMIETGVEPVLDTLEVLAHHQGLGHDSETGEEPGRVLHELRIGEMGVFGLRPGEPYYGSIDATPLFVVVLGQCHRWGAPEERIWNLLPAARRAVAWCRDHVDDLGFIQSRPDPSGITNQGWKDSGDAMVEADGSIHHGPTSPVEVQGYHHAALLALAELEAATGAHGEAERLVAEAGRLRARFAEHYLVDGPAVVALALDGGGRPLDVRASNAGHLLSTGIVDVDIADRLVTRLFDRAEHSGWGIRTLAATEAAYNPLGYHRGSVWPHDNAIILRGLARRRYDDEVRRLSTDLVDLAVAGGGQLPELLGGFDRATIPDPVPYLQSARPQAWAAAVPFQIVTSLLGLEPDIPRGVLALRPVLAPGRRLVVDGLRLGPRTIRIEAEGRSAAVTGDVDDLKVEIG